MKSAKATLNWIPGNSGGRTSLPDSRYITVARFEDEKEKYPTEAWSLIVEVETADDSGGMTADVRFLAEEAPYYLLRSGGKFELYEGHKLVATGVIV